MISVIIRISVQCILAIWIGLHLSAVAAQTTLQPLPPLLRTLSDEVGVLSVDEGLKLSRSMEAVLDETGVRVVMVIAETTKPEAVKDYAERLAQRWKRERGIDPERSIFVVVAVQDREMRVMPGKALESVDRELSRPGAYGDLAPLFRTGRYFEALMSLNAHLLELVRRRKNAI